MGDPQEPAPSIGDVVAALDALAAAARKTDRDAYLAALERADALSATEEQVLDAYRWGRRGMGSTELFDHRGEPGRRPRSEDHDA